MKYILIYITIYLLIIGTADASRDSDITINNSNELTSITHGYDDDEIANLLAMGGALQGIHFDKSTRVIQKGVGLSYLEGDSDAWGVAGGAAWMTDDNKLLSFEAAAGQDSAMIVFGFNW